MTNRQRPRPEQRSDPPWGPPPPSAAGTRARARHPLRLSARLPGRAVGPGPRRRATSPRLPGQAHADHDHGCLPGPTASANLFNGLLLAVFRSSSSSQTWPFGGKGYNQTMWLTASSRTLSRRSMNASNHLSLRDTVYFACNSSCVCRISFLFFPRIDKWVLRTCLF